MMKKYQSPCYEIEAVGTEDIVLSSPAEAVKIEQIGSTSAKVSASVYDILGIR